MTDDEVETKFRKQAESRLSNDAQDAILQRIWNLDQLDDVGEVVQGFAAGTDQA